MMVKKQCPNCFRQSYSSTAKGIWICPYCHSDITDTQAKEIDVRGDRLNLLKQRHDWKQLAPRNRGPLMVECDYNYPGGFYIRHKEAFRYCITGTRLDIENMIENALAALGENCGRIIVYDDAEKKWFDEVKGVALEGLDQHLTGWLNSKGVENSFLKKQFFMNLLWEALANVRVNERAPAFELNMGNNEKVYAQDIEDASKTNNMIALEIINTFRNIRA